MLHGLQVLDCMSRNWSTVMLMIAGSWRLLTLVTTTPILPLALPCSAATRQRSDSAARLSDLTSLHCATNSSDSQSMASPELAQNLLPPISSAANRSNCFQRLSAIAYAKGVREAAHQAEHHQDNESHAKPRIGRQ